MTRLMRTYTTILLVLVLAFTGHSMAIARGMPNAAGEIILCTNAGIVSVAVDENGQPVDKPHICPDCALSFSDVVHQDLRLPIRPLGMSECLATPRSQIAWPADNIRPFARGPPVHS